MKIAIARSPWLRLAAGIVVLVGSVGCTPLPLCTTSKCISEKECCGAGSHGNKEECCLWDPQFHGTAWTPLAPQLHGCNHNYFGYDSAAANGAVAPAATAPTTGPDAAPADEAPAPGDAAPADVSIPSAPDLDPPPRINRSGFTR